MFPHNVLPNAIISVTDLGVHVVDQERYWAPEVVDSATLTAAIALIP